MRNWKSVQEFWAYRELFFFFVWRDVKIRYKQTVFGALWALIQPIFTMVVFTLFFGKLAKMPSEGIPYPLFFYSALVPWTYFSGAIAMSGNSLVNNRNLIQKIYFPRITMPSAPVLAGLLDFAIASVVVYAMMIYYHFPFTWGMLLWIPLLFVLVILATGVGMFLSAINVRYRDIRFAIPFFLQIWLFVTPIIYPGSVVPERFRPLLALNPLSGIIEAFRSSLLGTKQIDWTLLLISTATTVAIFIFALWYFKRTERYFADII